MIQMSAFCTQGSVEDYNQAVDKALEAWKTWREVRILERDTFQDFVRHADC